MLRGHKLLVSLLKEKSTAKYYSAKLEAKYFINEELSIYNFIEAHINDHGVLPDTSTVSDVFGELPSTHEPYTFYLQQIEDRFRFNIYKNTVKEVSDLLQQKSTLGIAPLLENAVSTVTNSGSRFKVMDFADEAILTFEKIQADAWSGTTGILLGWPTLDKTTLGMKGGDIFVIAGNTGSGKTFMNLWIAYNAYAKQNKSVIFLSMEMRVEDIAARLIGLLAEVNMSHMLSGMLSTAKKKDIVVILELLKGKNERFKIIDGNLKSKTEDVSSLIHQYKPDLGVVDGAYLLRHSNERLDRYIRVAENVETLKQIAQKYNIPLLLSYQFKRKDGSKKKEEKPTLDDIGSSSAIGQIASVALGLVQPDSTSTLKSREIKVMKGRNGESGEFNVAWDFDALNFAEITPTDTDTELQYD